MGLRLFLTGSEGTGKTSCAAVLVSRLSRRHSVLTTDPEAPTFWKEGGPNALAGDGWTRAHRWLRGRAKRLGITPLFLVANFVLRWLLARWLEATRRPELSVYDADLWIHPVVYARYHFAPLQRLSPRPLLRATALFAGDPSRALFFHLDRPAVESAARIEDREDVDHADVDRNLDRVAGEFQAVIAAARELGAEVVRIDAADRTPEELADALEPRIRARLRGDAGLG